MINDGSPLVPSSRLRSRASDSCSAALGVITPLNLKAIISLQPLIITRAGMYVPVQHNALSPRVRTITDATHRGPTPLREPRSAGRPECSSRLLGVISAHSHLIRGTEIMSVRYLVTYDMEKKSQ